MLYIAENLKELRKKKDLTQEEIAEIFGVSAQSISKWERGESYPDITFLPALVNFYKISIDELIGMDKINDVQERTSVFMKGQKYLREGNHAKAVEIYTDALKIFPNDMGITSELALALAFDQNSEMLKRSISLCERVLSGNSSEKLRHTTRAALCFIYLKNGEKEKATLIAKNLPHVRESRETILAQLEKELTVEDIDTYLKYITVGVMDK